MTTATKPQFTSTLKADPSSDVYRSESHPLDSLFLPNNVAVIGASERAGSVGRSVLWNLLSSPFGGTVFPVNAKRSSVLGIKAYPSIKDLPDKVDLVVVTTPADSVPDLIAESVKRFGESATDARAAAGNKNGVASRLHELLSM